jgi:hypothetical protein
MTVVRLRDGSLFLHSPVRLDSATRQGLDRLGPVRALVAPNRFHHFFIREYVAAYPGARAYAAPGLGRKRRDLVFHAELGDQAPAEWRGEIEQHVFRGAPWVSEVVFYHPATRTLILTDLAFNVPAGKTAGARVFYWVVGAAGRFGPHRLGRLLIRDRPAARTSVARILQWDFDRVIVSHGEVLADGGPAKVAQGFAFLG